MDNTNNTPLHNESFKKARAYSVISTIIHQCSIRVVFPLGILSVYVFSYFINQGNITKKQFNLSVFPISLFTFTMTLTIPIAGITEQIIGQRLTIVLSHLIMLVGLTVLYFSNSAYLALATYVILGFGQGLSYMLTVKSSTYFFPKNAGLMTSLINSTSSIAAAIFNIFAEFILINPKQIQPEEGSGVYVDIKDKTYSNYIIMAGAVLTVFLIPTLIFFTISLRYKQQYEKGIKLLQEDTTQKLYNDQTVTSDDKDNNENVTKESGNNNNKHSKELLKKNLKRVFTTFPIYRLCFECFLTAFLPLLIYNTYKPVSLQNKRDNAILAVTTSVAAIALAFANPLWGYFYDKISFKPLIITMGVGGLIDGAFFLVAIHSDYLITLSVLFNNVLLGAAQTIFFPHVVKIFGLAHSMIVSGVIGLGMGIVSMFSCVFSYIIKNIYNEDVTGYYVIYGVGISLALVSLFLSCTEKEEKFDYGEDGMYEDVNDNVEEKDK